MGQGFAVFGLFLYVTSASFAGAPGVKVWHRLYPEYTVSAFHKAKFRIFLVIEYSIYYLYYVILIIKKRYKIRHFIFQITNLSYVSTITQHKMPLVFSTNSVFYF